MAKGPQTDLKTSNNKRRLRGKGASGARGAGSSLAEPQQHKQVAETTAQKEAENHKKGTGTFPDKLIEQTGEGKETEV